MLSAASPPQARYYSRYNNDPGGGYSGRPPLDCPLRYHPRYPGRGDPSGRPGDSESFFADDAEFDGSEQRSAQILKLVLERRSDQGYFPEPAKFIFIEDSPNQEEAVKQ